MDVLALLKRSIEELPNGSHRRGLFSVMKHIDVASRYLNRASEIGEDDLYTDVIYRTNQAFEGSIKEAYRVLSDADPDKSSIYEIEEYLKGDKVLRPRVLTQFTRYRQEWRNPSTHDYTLDFDQDEAFLALMSVSAFAKVLVDQISQKLAEKQAAERSKTAPKESAAEGLLDFAGREAADLLNILAQENARPKSESELIGTLAGFLADGEMEFQFESRIGNGPRRADMLISRGKELLVVEAKSSKKPRTLEKQHEVHMASVVQDENDSKGLLILWHPDGKGYEYVEWPPESENSNRLGVVIYSSLDDEENSSEPTLGDILGNALKSTGAND